MRVAEVVRSALYARLYSRTWAVIRLDQGRSCLSGVSYAKSIPAPNAPPMCNGVRPMENRSPQGNVRVTRLIDRLDGLAREMNAFLLVLAIGLAALDVTGFV